MNNWLLKIGDEVIVTIPQENREWDYNPCDDGTKATVLGFSEIYYGRLGNFGSKPGVYINRAWVKLRLQDGREHTELSTRLELADKDEYRRRSDGLRAYQRVNHSNLHSDEFLRELPETPFWEGDFVRVFNHPTLTNLHRDIDIFQIIGVDYQYLTERTLLGAKYPMYRMSDKLDSVWQILASEDDIVLVERGPVWKFYHNEPITFSDIREEAQFFVQLGHTEEVRNPANDLYIWTKGEVLDAIRSGNVHGFSMSSTFFGGEPSIRARRFRDEDLGRRIAQATLEGFELV